ncbi:hypothetical protein ABFS83_11G132500 [Erythranthe nasuta]
MKMSRELEEIWTMMIRMFRSPPLHHLISFPTLITLSSQPSNNNNWQISPPFGALFICISVALMLFGAITFFIGFFLLPLVIILCFLFSFAALVSKLFEFGRSLLCPASSSTSSSNYYNLNGST